MSRVEISVDGRHVVVDGEGDLDDLAKTAMNLWEARRVVPTSGPSCRLRGHRATVVSPGPLLVDVDCS